MTKKEIYRNWAPIGVKWTEWVRPVPFVMLDNNLNIREYYNFNIPKINYKIDDCKNTAVIVDLPGIESITEGLALSKIGFRPIPIYNGTDETEGAKATTDNHTIKMGLIYGANELIKQNISNEAPPAFLLDSNRINRFKMNASIFDNSWDIYAQDLPSAEFFIKNDINKIIVRSKFINKDLKKILYQFQQKKIRIFLNNGIDDLKLVNLTKSVNKYKN